MLSRDERRMLIGLFVLSTLITISYAGSRVCITLLAIDLGASPLAIGIMQSLFQIVFAILGVQFGRWIDRFGPRLPMLIGTGVTGFAVLLPGAWPVLGTLFLSAALIGTTTNLYYMAQSQLVGKTASAENRTTILAMIALSFSIGILIGPIVAGYTIDGVGFRAALLVLALPALGALLALHRGGLRIPTLPPRAGDRGSQRVFDLLRDPSLRRGLLIGVVLSSAWESLQLLVPLHGSRMGLSASQIGVVLSGFAAASFISRFIVPLLRNATIRRWYMLLGCVLCGACFCVVPFVSSVPLLYLLIFLVGMSVGSAQPMVINFVIESAPDNRVGEALGLRATLISMNQAGIPILFGAAGSALGTSPMFFVMAVAMFYGAHMVRSPVGSKQVA